MLPSGLQGLLFLAGPWASLYCYLWCKREGCAGRCAGWPRGPKGPPGLLANAVWTQLRPRREEAQASILHRERKEGPPQPPPSPGAPGVALRPAGFTAGWVKELDPRPEGAPLHLVIFHHSQQPLWMLVQKVVTKPSKQAVA